MTETNEFNIENETLDLSDNIIDLSENIKEAYTFFAEIHNIIIKINNTNAKPKVSISEILKVMQFLETVRHNNALEEKINTLLHGLDELDNELETRKNVHL